MSMPFLAAPTLRSCLSRRAGFDAKNIACRLATVVSTANRSGWRHHDLKPENIILSADGLVLIDPGHFGPLQLMSGQTVDVAITTPAYNPGIEPNDLMAFGLIFFELVTGVLPTRFASSSHDSDAGKSLLLMIEEAEITGNFNYSGLKCFQRPAKLFSGCSDQLERLMLFLLGLELQDDKIEVRNEPVTWVEAIEMLHQTTFTGLT